MTTKEMVLVILALALIISALSAFIIRFERGKITSLRYGFYYLFMFFLAGIIILAFSFKD